MDHETDRGEMAARETELRERLRLKSGLIARSEGTQRSRFPSAMTERKATARAKASTRSVSSSEFRDSSKGKAAIAKKKVKA
jgi:hypothetical protein